VGTFASLLSTPDTLHQHDQPNTFLHSNEPLQTPHSHQILQTPITANAQSAMDPSAQIPQIAPTNPNYQAYPWPAGSSLTPVQASPPRHSSKRPPPQPLQISGLNQRNWQRPSCGMEEDDSLICRRCRSLPPIRRMHRTRSLSPKRRRSDPAPEKHEWGPSEEARTP
jgi:hypothetical protein